MNVKLFCVYDCKSEIFKPPFTALTTADALRSWAAICNDPQTQISMHPADFTLFELGTYDQTKGEFTLYAAKVSLGTALEQKAQSEQLSLQMPSVPEQKKSGVLSRMFS